MIYIWDNGRDYSDHTIEFVESDLPREDVEAIMASYVTSEYVRLGEPVRREARVEGVAERIDWRDGENETLVQWVGRYTKEGHGRDCPVHLEWGDVRRCDCHRRPSIDAALKHGLIKVEDVVGG